MKQFTSIMLVFICLFASCDSNGGGDRTEPSASFTFSPLSPTTGQVVQFTDTSSGDPTSWQWDMGDGTSSLSQNPSHVFSTAEAHTVTLTVGNSRGTDAASQVVVVLPGTTPSTRFPLKVSANGRYLVDQNDVPFFMVGDAPQGGMVGLSLNDANDYFANRASYGINTAWFNLLAGAFFSGRSDFSTFDGIVPFTTAGNYSTPNEAYFSRVDGIINAAAAHDIIVFLDPAETIDSLNVMRSNGTTKCAAYGRYLGNRYKDFPNIIWASGNDFQTWSDPGDDAVVHAVAAGIKATDARHLHTVMLDYYISSSTDDSRWSDIIDINSAYTYYPTYAEVGADYNLIPRMPVITSEADYEFENGATAERLRRQTYWTFLAGGCGYIYGNYYIWPIRSGWKTYLDTTGAMQLSYCGRLFKSIPWYSLVPDQSHVLVTSGYGTFSSGGDPHSSISENDYAAAAFMPAGQLAIVYIPTARTIIVDLTQLSGTIIARWFDPTTGAYQTVSGSPFPNSITQAFSTPGYHSDSSSDWILVLEKQ